MLRRSVVLLAALLTLSSFTAFAGAPSSAQAIASSGLAVLKTSVGPLPPAHSVELGPLSPAADVHVDITLKVPDPASLAAFIASLSDRDSPEFHHFLQPGQLGPRFGPSLSELADVEAVLRSDGLHLGQVTSDRLSIPVTAPASLIDRAFHVDLERFRLPGGRTAFTNLSAPSIAASVAADINGVVGLSDLAESKGLLSKSRSGHRSTPQTTTVLHPNSAGPSPCAAASSTASGAGSYTADQLASYYGMTPLYALGDFGQGVRVAVAEFEANLPSDVEAYQACYGTNTTVHYHEVDGGPTGASDGTGEAALDIEDIIGLAPDDDDRRLPRAQRHGPEHSRCLFRHSQRRRRRGRIHVVGRLRAGQRRVTSQFGTIHV